MKTLSKFMIAAAALVLVVAPAFGAAQVFFGNLDETTSQVAVGDEHPWHAYYQHGGGVSSDVAAACTQAIDGVWCQGWFRGPAKEGPAYRGYNSDIFNYDGVEGNFYSIVWAHEKGTGTADHRGYYHWTCAAVNVGERSDWTTPDCSGSDDPASCLGNGNPSIATGTDNTPLGTIAAVGGLSAMPVPTVSGVTGSVVDLSWKAAVAAGCGGEAEYDLYYFIDDLTDGACDMPNETQFTFLATYPANAASVDVSTDLGGDSFDPDTTDNGIVFALKLRNNAAGEVLTSRYFSANGQCVSFSGLAVELYDLEVQIIGRGAAEVSWKTSAEDGLRGFYVTRSFTEDGPYTVVSDFIAANGEPSAYSFIDKVQAGGRFAGRGLFYKIQTIDIDDEVQNFGPVAATVPELPGKFRRPARR